MTKQFCVRTYDSNAYDYPWSKDNCNELNLALKEGWKVVMVTPKPDYNEYILEKEFADKEGIGHGKELCEQEEGV